MTLHPYQVRAVKHLHDNPRAALFLEMGLGKTIITLTALRPEHLPALVVAPKRVAENVWPEEGAKWRPDLQVWTASGTPAQRRRTIDAEPDVLVVGVENLKDVPVGRYRTIIIDELSQFKSRQSKRWAILRRHTRKARYVWGLTGTPMANGLLDLWAQMYLIDNGERLDTAITRFRSRYFRPAAQLPNGVITKWVPHETTQGHVERMLSDIALSMKAEDYLDMPSVIFNRVDVTMPPSAMQTYESMREEMIADMTGAGDLTIAANAAVRTGKLSQITAGFLYGPEGEVNVLHDAKIEALTEVLDGSDGPVLIFYRFTAEAEMIRRAVPRVVKIDETSVDAWNAGRVPVMMAHPASAAHGLNLQKGPGHTIVWTSPTWSLDEYAQANARLHRQGQKRPVIVHHLAVPDSVDTAILSRVREKKSLQDAVLEALKV